jgi:hypothetical protein
MVRLSGSRGEAAVRDNEARFTLWTGETETVPAPAERSSSLDLAVADIVECLLSGRPPASTGEDGLAALEMIIGFHASYREQGRWIPLPLRGADRELNVAIG